LLKATLQEFSQVLSFSLAQTVGDLFVYLFIRRVGICFFLFLFLLDFSNQARMPCGDC